MRASFPAGVTSSASTKRIKAGTLWEARWVRQSARISSQISFERLALPFGEHDVRHYDRARNRALARFRARHPDLRMTIDNGLDLLGMNFQAADIDDAAAPADEVVAIAAQLHHVARVDKAVRVGQRGCVFTDISVRGALGANPQRAVDDFHLDAVALGADQLLRGNLQGRR